RREPRFGGTTHDANGIARGEPLPDIGRAIGRSVVHDDELPLASAQRGRESSDELGERSRLVVGRDDHRCERRHSVACEEPYLCAVRVTFDARHLQTVARVRGIGRYTRNLLAAFARLAPADVEWTLLRLR